MKVYLVPKEKLSRSAVYSHLSWEIPTPPQSINLLDLRSFLLKQAITLTHLSQIAPENLPYLVVDSPAWLAGDEFLIFNCAAGEKEVYFRMPRPQIDTTGVQFQKATLLDWVSFTYQLEQPYHYSARDLWIEKLNQQLIPLLGFGITSPKDKGFYGYTDSFRLGNNWGIVAVGGSSQLGTVLVSINGQGCSIAQNGWEARLQQVLQTQVASRLTRVDIAYDDYEGQFLTPENARAECQQQSQGIFFTQGRAPSWELVGDWDSPTGRKTLYVGSCHSDKRLRIYTKGRALGDPMSPWIRSELVLKHSKRFILPLEILTHSTPYLAAAYSTAAQAGPFQFLMDSVPPASRLKTASQTIQISLAHQIRYGKRAVGKLVTTLKTLGYSDSQIIGMLTSSGTPAKLINTLELLNRFS
jgi:phage replication initiation protein